MSNSLAIYQQFEQIQSAALALQKSGYFTDVKSEAQAIVKVMAGAELGLPPFAAMSGIHIIQGKPVLGANALATLIKNDPRYNYKVVELTDTICSIDFYENGAKVGNSTFTAEDAKKAGSKNMQKHPKNMLFARAISNGAKWHTPGVYGGSPVYTPDEFDMEVDDDGDPVLVDAVIVDTTDTRHFDPAWQDEQVDNSEYANVGGSKGLYKDQTVDNLQWSRKGLLKMIEDFGEVTEQNVDKYDGMKLKLEAVEHYIAVNS